MFCDVRVVDGMNITMSDEHMWMVPFTMGEDHILEVSFPQAVEMSALRLWNYNKSPEDTYRGVSTNLPYLFTLI